MGDGITGRVTRLGIGTPSEDVDVTEKVGNMYIDDGRSGNNPISLEAKRAIYDCCTLHLNMTCMTTEPFSYCYLKRHDHLLSAWSYLTCLHTMETTIEIIRVTSHLHPGL